MNEQQHGRPDSVPNVPAELINGVREAISHMAQIVPTLDANRAGIDLYGAPAFSAFSIFAPNENTLSRVVVELFDPAGSHGQGALFLNAMLRAIGLPSVNLREAIRVRREVLTRARRRIDIVIETPRYVIGIENKPWAVQQPNQLGDYLSELSADLRGRTPVLVFLSDQEEETAPGQVTKLPYYSWEAGPSLHEILRSVLNEVKAAAPKAFVADFITHIDAIFGDGPMADVLDAPYIDAVKAEFEVPGQRKALATFVMAASTLYWQIVDDIGEHILATVKAEVAGDFIVSSGSGLAACLNARYSPWGIRRPKWPDNCIVAIESQQPYLDQIKFGVKAPDKARLGQDEQHLASLARPLLEGLVASAPGGRKSVHWPWEQPVWERSWSQEFAARLVIQSPTGKVCDHPEIRELASKFVEVTELVEKSLNARNRP